MRGAYSVQSKTNNRKEYTMKNIVRHAIQLICGYLIVTSLYNTITQDTPYLSFIVLLLSIVVYSLYNNGNNGGARNVTSL